MATDAPLKNLIQITITRETQTIKVASFNTILLVDEVDDASPPFVGRTKSYASILELAGDGYTAGDYVYDSAANIFAQNPSVSSIKVGLKYITTTPDASWTAAMNAIQTADPDWYGFTIISEVLADQSEVADWAEAAAPKVLFAIRSNSADIIDPVSTTDIAYYIQNSSYERSFVYYHSGTNAEYIDAAALGERFPRNPGTGTWMYKTLASVSIYALTSAERTAALDKNCNIYISYAGVGTTEAGTVGVGEYIDIMRGTDWLESTIQADLFTVLKNIEKVPYTDPGVDSMVSIIKGSLQKGVNRNFINAGFTVTAPLVADVSVNDKGNRILPDITFTATYSGAIHTIQITGTISL